MQEILLSPDLVIRCLIGFAVGGLIGLERQKRMTEESSIGVRSFGLHSLFGMLGAYTYTVTANPVVLVYSIAISTILVMTHIIYKIFRTMRKGMTTSIVFALSFVLGTLVGLDEAPVAPQIIGPLSVLSMTVSFLVFLVLSFKQELSEAVQVITREEMISAVELGVLILFLWPLVPQTIQIGPILFPLFQTYLLIVILLGISFANYILVKKYKNRGPYFFGFFGGFANSEATVSSLTDFHVQTESRYTGRISLSVIFANLAMVLRNGFIIVLLDRELRLIQYFLVPLVILFIMGIVRMFYERRENEDEEEQEMSVRFVSPFEFGAAVRFAVIFTAVSLASLFLQEYFSEWGLVAAGFIGGFASAGAVVAVASQAFAAGTVSLSSAVFAVTIATTTSVFNKIIYAAAGDRESNLVKRVARDAILMGTGVVIYLILLGLGFIPLV
ncbi:DUF4010 domain-containing protein [Candidatus Thorarchaeota archaeon]|nr:MAG: DUF4010 domain-containing protein [Candidatus Thorarchaeota archaeon]